MNYEADSVDPYTRVIYLEVPGSKVVVFQAHFELYEGVGTVRTIDVRRSLVCVMTTPTMLEDCFRVLEAIQDEIGWRFASNLSAADKEKYLGYQKKDPELQK